MKLFVWANPYPVSYGSSMVFAVAETLEAARAEILGGNRYSYGEFFDGSGAPIPTAQIEKLGEPTRIVDLPCAEWHMWQE